MPRLCNPGWLLCGLAVCAVEALADAAFLLRRARWADTTEAGIVRTAAGPPARGAMAHARARASGG